MLPGIGAPGRLLLLSANRFQELLGHDSLVLVLSPGPGTPDAEPHIPTGFLPSSTVLPCHPGSCEKFRLGIKNASPDLAAWLPKTSPREGLIIHGR